MFANIGEFFVSSSMLEPLAAELSPEWVVAEGRLGMRLSMPRARAVEEYSNSSKVKWGVNCIRKQFYDE